MFVHVFGDVFVQSLGVAYSMSGARMRAAVEWRQTSEPGRATIHQPVENRTTPHTHLRTSFFFLKLYLYLYFWNCICIPNQAGQRSTNPSQTGLHRTHTCVQVSFF